MLLCSAALCDLLQEKGLGWWELRVGCCWFLLAAWTPRRWELLSVSSLCKPMFWQMRPRLNGVNGYLDSLMEPSKDPAVSFLLVLCATFPLVIFPFFFFPSHVWATLLKGCTVFLAPGEESNSEYAPNKLKTQRMRPTVENREQNCYFRQLCNRKQRASGLVTAG